MYAIAASQREFSAQRGFRIQRRFPSGPGAAGSEQAQAMRIFEQYRVKLNRLSSSIYIPRHAGSFGVVALLAGIGCYGMAAGGHTMQTLTATAAGVGLGVDKVEISGNKRLSDIDVLQALGLDGETALPALNIERARAAISALPRVEKVSVRKIYPDRLAVKITERKPFAVWQKDGAVGIIDVSGHVIAPYSRADGQGLPFFVGAGAAAAAQSFLSGMRRFPDLAGRARAYIRVADRRWDILLDNGLRIKLPEENPFGRLAAAEAEDKKSGLFSRDITGLDLRLPDRMTVALSDGALARWQDTVNQAEKRENALKNGGQA